MKFNGRLFSAIFSPRRFPSSSKQTVRAWVIQQPLLPEVVKGKRSFNDWMEAQSPGGGGERGGGVIHVSFSNTLTTSVIIMLLL